MDIYTLEQESLGKDKVFDEYSSLIWTERHIEPGEVSLVVPATEENYDALMPGTLLAHPNSRELMLIDTRAYEDGMITATGPSAETFLDERNNGAFTATDTPGNIMVAVVQSMIDRQYETSIPNLYVGSAEQGDDSIVEEEIKVGPCYTTLMGLARKYGYHFGLYRVSAGPGAWELHFSVRLGKDLTKDQTSFKPVRFSPSLDSLASPKEVVSDRGFKSVVVAMPPDLWFHLTDKVVVTADPIKVSRVAGGDDYYQPWRERVKEVDCSDITMAMLGPDDRSDVDKLDFLNSIMLARAQSELRHQERPNITDGEITPEAQYREEGDNDQGDNVTTYALGDRVEVQGHFGEIRKGTVTEYTRASDNTGARSYPAVSEKRVPVLRKTLGEQVLAWYSFSDGFWSDPDLSKAKPTFFDVLEGEKKLAGIANLGIPSADMVKFRWRWGDHSDDSHFKEYPAPVPRRPPASTEVQATINWDFTLGEDGPFRFFRLESTSGGDFGFWVPETQEIMIPDHHNEWWIYGDHSSDENAGFWWTDIMLQSIDVVDSGTGERTQDAWTRNGWMAVTQLIPTTTSVDA